MMTVAGAEQSIIYDVDDADTVGGAAPQGGRGPTGKSFIDGSFVPHQSQPTECYCFMASFRMYTTTSTDGMRSSITA